MQVMFVRAVSYFGVLLVGIGTLRGAHKLNVPREGSADADRIAVVGHVALKDATPCRMTLAEHGRRRYLYLDHERTPTLTAVDVTDVRNPTIAGEIGRASVPGEVRVMAGKVGLLQSPGQSVPAASREITIVDFADGGNPRVLRRFANVTGYAESPGKALIFVVNPEGLWILRPQAGTDVELEKEYERHVLYDR